MIFSMVLRFKVNGFLIQTNIFRDSGYSAISSKKWWSNHTEISTVEPNIESGRNSLICSEFKQYLNI